jgi:hypothetical protein
MNCHPVCEAIGDMAYGFTVFSQESLTFCWRSTPVSLCWSTEWTLDYSQPFFIIPSSLLINGAIQYTIDCFELVEYRRQWLWLSTSSHCIVIITFESIVQHVLNWLIWEMGLDTQSMSLIL